MRLWMWVSLVCVLACEGDKDDSGEALPSETGTPETGTPETGTPETGTPETGETGSGDSGDKSVELEPVCGELGEATTAMALEGTIDASGGKYLVCHPLGDGGACPDYAELSSGFIEATIGNPWGDPMCWYSASAMCGPETTIEDRCCYAFLFDGIMCA